MSIINPVTCIHLFSLLWSLYWCFWSANVVKSSFYTISQTLIACTALQLRSFKSGTMLNMPFMFKKRHLQWWCWGRGMGFYYTRLEVFWSLFFCCLSDRNWRLWLIITICWQCCNKSSHWLGLELTRVAIFDLTWLDSIFHLNDLTWLESPVKWLWLDSDSTACWLESVMTNDSSHYKSNDTHMHKVFNVNNVELWTMIVPSFNFRWENIKLVLPSH